MEEQKGGFLKILLGTSGASVLRIFLAGKAIYAVWMKEWDQQVKNQR